MNDQQWTVNSHWVSHLPASTLPSSTLGERRVLPRYRVSEGLKGQLRYTSWLVCENNTRESWYLSVCRMRTYKTLWRQTSTYSSNKIDLPPLMTSIAQPLCALNYVDSLTRVGRLSRRTSRLSLYNPQTERSNTFHRLEKYVALVKI